MDSKEVFRQIVDTLKSSSLKLRDVLYSLRLQSELIDKGLCGIETSHNVCDELLNVFTIYRETFQVFISKSYLLFNSYFMILMLLYFPFSLILYIDLLKLLFQPQVRYYKVACLVLLASSHHVTLLQLSVVKLWVESLQLWQKLLLSFLGLLLLSALLFILWWPMECCYFPLLHISCFLMR